MNSFSPRQELAELTRSRIIMGAAHLIEAGEPLMFRDLSRISGIPERTIYRHFPHKDAVLDAFWIWLNRDIAVPDSPEGPGEIPDYARALFAAFDRRSSLVRAMIASPSGQKLRDARAVERRAKFERALRPLTERLPERDGHALQAGIEAICSASGWNSLVGTMGASAADVAIWALEAMLDRARRQIDLKREDS